MTLTAPGCGMGERGEMARAAMALRDVHGLKRKPSVYMSESERMPG